MIGGKEIVGVEMDRLSGRAWLVSVLHSAAVVAVLLAIGAVLTRATRGGLGGRVRMVGVGADARPDEALRGDGAMVGPPFTWPDEGPGVAVVATLAPMPHDDEGFTVTTEEIAVVDSGRVLFRRGASVYGTPAGGSEEVPIVRAVRRSDGGWTVVVWAGADVWEGQTRLVHEASGR